MSRPFFRMLIVLLASVAFVWGCATPLPPTYGEGKAPPVLKGPVLALAGEGDLVAAVTDDGLFIKKGPEPWVAKEVPGITRWDRVTCLAVSGGVIYLGSDGEGLYIYSDGAWEVRTSRYDGLPDDGVLSLAVDKKGMGPIATDVWVGTREGVAVFRDGKWSLYTPGKDWLVAMTGKSGKGTGKVYLGSGFRLGRKGEDSSLFEPPVTAIGIGEDRVLLGNEDSSIAQIGKDSVVIMKLEGSHSISKLAVGKNVMWAGTNKGLLWGGLEEVAEGKPWPTHHSYLFWRAALFGSRDSRPFDYRIKMLGYNNAPVVDLQLVGSDLWVAHNYDKPVKPIRSHFNPKLSEITDQPNAEPMTTIRRYVNIDEYIARSETPRYETYGSSAGVRGDPTAIYAPANGKSVWIGTKRGLWGLYEN